MTCRDVQPLTGSFLDGELPEEMLDRIQRHVLRCDACRCEVESLRTSLDVLRTGLAIQSPGEPFILSALHRLQLELDCQPDYRTTPVQLVLGIGPGSFEGTLPQPVRTRHRR